MSLLATRHDQEFLPPCALCALCARTHRAQTTFFADEPCSDQSGLIHRYISIGIRFVYNDPFTINYIPAISRNGDNLPRFIEPKCIELRMNSFLPKILGRRLSSCMVAGKLRSMSELKRLLKCNISEVLVVIRVEPKRQGRANINLHTAVKV